MGEVCTASLRTTKTFNQPFSHVLSHSS